MWQKRDKIKTRLRKKQDQKNNTIIILYKQSKSDNGSINKPKQNAVEVLVIRT